MYNLMITPTEFALLEACLRVVYSDIKANDDSRTIDFFCIVQNMTKIWKRIPDGVEIKVDKTLKHDLQDLILLMESCPCCECNPCDCHGVND